MRIRHISAVPGLRQEDWIAIRRFVDLLTDFEFLQQLRANCDSYAIPSATGYADPVAQIDLDIELLTSTPWRKHNGQAVIDNTDTFTRLVNLARSLPENTPRQLPSKELTRHLQAFNHTRRLPTQRAA